MTSITYKQNGTTVLGDLTYAYDKNGNRITTGGSFARTGIPQAVGSTAYNAANQQTTFADKTLTYDNNGNLQTITDSSGTTTYTWNARNHLVGISGPGVSASFVYDGLGRRESKTINSNVTEFLYDGLDPVQETSGAPVLANMLSGAGLDEFITRADVSTGATSTFLADALGSALALADSAGAVQTEYTYEPFGTTTSTGASNTSSYQYTGRENDGTGLYYYRARYYHPTLARFIGEDPRGFAAGVNFYSYVENDPINFVDPLGFDKKQSSCSVNPSSGGVRQYLSGVASAASMFGQFVTGTGPNDSTFGPESVESQMMASSPGVTDAVNGYLSGDQNSGLYTFGLYGFVAAGANPIQQFVGSYTYNVTQGNGGLNVTVSNIRGQVLQC